MEEIKTFENRLAKEKSPYLLQHKYNPVDWYAWGEEAFQKAREENKLIFLSVGYSTCHWCHVMNSESFENPEVAQVMNENFVNIKLDREERPDVDKVYMTYVQASFGGGGWPMSVWLTPDLKPIFGGTYFPPNNSYGRPGFVTILKALAQKWKTSPDEMAQQGNRLISMLNEEIEKPQSESFTIDKEPVLKCFTQISKGYDPKFGGFSKAPKFPRPVIFNLLFQIVAREGPDSSNGRNALEMAAYTLTKMGEGGIFDHLGGGFHRYSVTSDWHIPHFEKMLYDQSQLVNSYLSAFQITHNPFFEQRAKDVLNYVMTTVTSKEGGFFSAEDADSLIEHGHPEHAEGAFYVFTLNEINQVLGEGDAKVFNYRYGVKAGGNVPPQADPHGELQNKNHLKIEHSLSDVASHFKMQEEQVEELLNICRKKLFDYREKRPRPHLDDKIICAWNGLMISAFARAYQTLGVDQYLTVAKNAAQFLYKNLYIPESKTLIRNYREGPSSVRGFTDDYAFLISGLLDLYEASFDPQYLKWALDLQESQNKLFWDSVNGAYFAVEAGDKNLVLRMKEDYDGAEPCNNSVAALNLLRLSQITGNQEYRTLAEKIFKFFANILNTSPIVVPQMCVAIDFYLQSPKHIIIVGKKGSPDTMEMLHEVHKNLMPNKVLLLLDDESRKYLGDMLPFTKDMTMIGNKATAYVCENFACQLPVNTVGGLVQHLTRK